MSATEEHYSVKELAAMWHLSPRQIRRILAKYADAIPNFQSKRRSRFGPVKRPHQTIRVPRSLTERIYRDLLPGTKPAA